MVYWFNRCNRSSSSCMEKGSNGCNCYYNRGCINNSLFCCSSFLKIENKDDYKLTSLILKYPYDITVPIIKVINTVAIGVNNVHE